jgi:cytochrome c
VAVGLFAPVAASAQQADGERLFRQRCGACHSMEAGQNRVGPHLSGVVGRAAGSVEGARYSDAMRDSGIVWDNQSLDTFLAAPRETVPGTTMTISIPDATQRAAIITYLESQ